MAQEYSPGPKPNLIAPEQNEVVDLAWEEFYKLAEVLSVQDTFQLAQSNVEPIRPRDGMIAYADGTNWNPGANGEGIYAYYNSTWNKLG